MMKRITPDKRELVNMLMDGVEVFTGPDKADSCKLDWASNWFRVTSSTGSASNMIWFEYPELFVEVPWYEGIPECGVLCWLNGDVVLCISRDGDRVQYQKTGSVWAVHYSKLIPLTRVDPRIIE